jgi:hypothetical protein
MLVISLSSLIDEAIADENKKNLSGNVSSFDKLLRKESLELLESKHKGLFAFLAFHPGADNHITEYIRQGSLSSDSGPNILVLFTLDSEAKWATPISSQSFGSWLDLDASIHPSYKMIQIMFNETNPPPLPGIVFFERFSAERDPVYVSLHVAPASGQVRDLLRTTFSLADRAFKSTREHGDFADSFSVELQKQKIVHQRAGKRSMSEWLVKAYQVAWDNKGDIVSVVGLFV